MQTSNFFWKEFQPLSNVCNRTKNWNLQNRLMLIIDRLHTRFMFFFFFKYSISRWTKPYSELKFIFIFQNLKRKTFVRNNRLQWCSSETYKWSNCVSVQSKHNWITLNSIIVKDTNICVPLSTRTEINGLGKFCLNEIRLPTQLDKTIQYKHNWTFKRILTTKAKQYLTFRAFKRATELLL